MTDDTHSGLALNVLLEAAQQPGGQHKVSGDLDHRVAVYELAEDGLLSPEYTAMDNLLKIQTSGKGDQLAQRVLRERGLLSDEVESLSDFPERVARVVQAIPEGETLSYQEVADRAGGSAPGIGAAMDRYLDSKLPWWRVTRTDGRIANRPPHREAQRQQALLRAEGVDREISN